MRLSTQLGACSRPLGLHGMSTDPSGSDVCPVGHQGQPSASPGPHGRPAAPSDPTFLHGPKKFPSPFEEHTYSSANPVEANSQSNQRHSKRSKHLGACSHSPGLHGVSTDLWGPVGAPGPAVRPVGPISQEPPNLGLHSRPATPIGTGRGYCTQAFATSHDRSCPQSPG